MYRAFQVKTQTSPDIRKHNLGKPVPLPQTEVACVPTEEPFLARGSLYPKGGNPDVFAQSRVSKALVQT